MFPPVPAEQLACLVITEKAYVVFRFSELTH